MREKPKKLLVSKGQYVGVMGEKLSLYAFGGLQLTGGFAAVILLWALWRGNHSTTDPEFQDANQVFAFAISALSLLLLVSGRFLFKKANKIDPVALITKRTSHLLPPSESLVRASDAPPSQQQAEFLRAAQSGTETPVEELLRATTDGKGE